VRKIKRHRERESGKCEERERGIGRERDGERGIGRERDGEREIELIIKITGNAEMPNLFKIT
jgi:hypothetical protein